jgi:hypothetical protein
MGVLIDAMPAESATIRSLAGEPGWTVTDHLLATVVDTLSISNWLFVAANSGKNSNNPKPKPLPRFGERAKEKAEADSTVVASSDLAGFFGANVSVVAR